MFCVASYHLFPVFTHPFLTPFFPTLKISVPLCHTFPFSSPCPCVTPIGAPGGGGVSVFPSAPGGGGVPDFSEFPRIAPIYLLGTWNIEPKLEHPKNLL